jgi:sugar lactone lactonase YvrE
MKKRVLALVLTLCLALSLPVLALESKDFEGGKLSGITLQSDGSMLVTDVYNKVIWRVAEGKVSRYAGVIPVEDLTGEPSGVFRNGAVDQAYFMEPWDIVPFLKGYAVSDTAANTIRYIENGRVMTLTGSQKAGNADGKADSATFDRPTGLALDDGGDLYVSDTGNGAIRRIGKDGTVSTVARNLNAPTGICWYDGALYVVETGRSRICRVTDGGSVTVLAGVSVEAEDEGEYYGGYADAPLGSAKFDHPQGIAVDAAGTFYIADTGNSAVRMIRDGRVYTILRNNGNSISPASPRGLLVSGGVLYVADAFSGSLTQLSLAEKTFSDVASDAWYADTVRFAVRSGLADGADSRFVPDALMDRSMFVEMLARVHRLVDGTVIIDGDATFSDVPDTASFAAAVRWAADNEIVLGDNGVFAANRGISRQELAAVLYRYAKLQGLTDLVGDYADLDKFSDAGEVGDWAIDAMRWACTKHILNGDGAGHLNPRDQATRAQALTMLLNFVKAYGL